MRTVADLLVDFGKPAPSGPAFAETPSFDFEQPEFGEPLDELDLAAPAEEVDVGALVEEAVAKAEAELRDRLEGEFQAALEAEKAAHAEALETLREECGREAGSALREQLAALEERLTSVTSSVTSQLLGPVLTASLQEKSVAILAAIIREAIRDSGAVRIRVCGPLSLFEALEAAVGEHSGRIEFTETDGFDLEVGIDESLYETRLSEWSHALSETLQ